MTSTPTSTTSMRRSEMSCADPGWTFEKHEVVNGVCPDCGEDTIDGLATEHCNYSPELCKTCGYAPCDESC